MSRAIYSIFAPVYTNFLSEFESKNPISEALHLASLNPTFIPGGLARLGDPRGPGVYEVPGRPGGPGGPGNPGDDNALKFWLGALGYMLYLCNSS